MLLRQRAPLGQKAFSPAWHGGQAAFTASFRSTKTIIFFVPIHMQQNGVTEATQRAAAFHPIRGVNLGLTSSLSSRERRQVARRCISLCCHEPFDVALLLPGEGQKHLPMGRVGFVSSEVLGGERFPRRRASFFATRRTGSGSSMSRLSSKPCANAPCCCPPGSARPSERLSGPVRSDPLRCGCKRQTQPNEVVRWISDNRLVEITQLNLDFAPGVFRPDQELPTWQSPQIQISGPWGSAPRSNLSSH